MPVGWVAAGVPLGLHVGIAASTLNTRHGKARGFLLLVPVALCVASAVLIVARVTAT